MSSTMDIKVPIVDFSAYSLDRDEPDPDRFQTLIDEVYSAFTTIGFVYLKHTGVSKEKVERAFEASRIFFALDEEEKLKCELPKKYMHGYSRLNRERAYKINTVILDPNLTRTHGDIGQGFNFSPGIIASSDVKQAWPETVPEFRESMEDMMQEAAMPVLLRVLEVMARGLKCKDPFYFSNAHKNGGTAKGGIRVRSCFYPATHNMDVKENQIRCGEHTDTGTVSLVFQHGQRGLQAQRSPGVWIDVPPIDDTIVVNIGDLMERWTSDRFLSTKHRVINPTTEAEKHFARQSIVLHGIPDPGTMIECIDGSNKYPPVDAMQYAHQQFNKFMSDKDVVQ